MRDFRSTAFQSAAGEMRLQRFPLRGSRARRHAAGTKFGCPPGPRFEPAAVSPGQYSAAIDRAAGRRAPDLYPAPINARGRSALHPSKSAFRGSARRGSTRSASDTVRALAPSTRVAVAAPGSPDGQSSRRSRIRLSGSDAPRRRRDAGRAGQDGLRGTALTRGAAQTRLRPAVRPGSRQRQNGLTSRRSDRASAAASSSF